KLCRSRARPVGTDTGLPAVRDAVAAGDVLRAATRGRIEEIDVLEAYADHLRRLAPVAGRPLRVVVDAGNGMAGLTAPAVFGPLHERVEIIPMYFELDGTFPPHEANPIDPDTLRDLRARVVAESADLGLAFDG